MNPSQNPLEEYFRNNRRNIIHKWTHYFDIYHRHFQKFVGKECVVLEIGVSQGGSLQMWKHYFGERSKIYGVDIMPECKQFEEDQIEIYIGSQADREFLRELKTKIPKIDILIDDGGHEMQQQIIAFEELFDHISESGIYLCEDTHTSYWEEYGGGYRKPDSFIEFTKSLIDTLNAWHIRQNELVPSKFTWEVGSLHYYDSIFVLEKQKRVQPWHEKRGMIQNMDDSSTELKDNLIFDVKLKILRVELPENIDIKMVRNDPGFIKYLFKEKYEGTIWPTKGETMIGFKRLTNLEFCLQETIKNNVAGDVIETGVWRGGACIFMRAILKINNITDKKVWVADSFEGLPKPDSDNYPEDSGDGLYLSEELSISLDEVKDNFRKYDLLDDQVVFLKGWFKDTLSSPSITKLSVLRLDGDLYESTIDALFYLYPKLSMGGYCIIDDWGAIPACKKAVEDYRNIFNIQERIQAIDWTGVFWKKEQEILEMSRIVLLEKIEMVRNGKTQQRHFENIIHKLETEVKNKEQEIQRLQTELVNQTKAIVPANIKKGTLKTKLIGKIKFYMHLKKISSHPFFDEEYYLKSNPDVKESGITPARHYLLYGGFEGRNPSEKFDSAKYLEQNPDVKDSGMNPLLHYLQTNPGT